VAAVFERTTRRTQVPVYGLVFAFIIGLVLFLPFTPRQSLVGSITSDTVVMYVGGPLASASFVAANWIIYRSGWEVDGTSSRSTST